MRSGLILAFVSAMATLPDVGRVKLPAALRTAATGRPGLRVARLDVADRAAADAAPGGCSWPRRRSRPAPCCRGKSGQNDVKPPSAMPCARANGPHTSGTCLARYALNWAEVPGPVGADHRRDGLRGQLARRRCRALIAGSDQSWMPPVKIKAMVRGERRRFVTSRPAASRRLYMSDVPPATIGR